MRASLCCALLFVAMTQSARAQTACSANGFARLHGNYPANRPPCVLNADNYFNHYLATLTSSTTTFTSTATDYPNINADFAGTGANGNLEKLTTNRIGSSCPSTVGTCGIDFWLGDDLSSFPGNELQSWASVALYNTAASNGKLLVFLTGSPSHAKAYVDFGLRAAHAGYRVILLSHIVYGATACITDWPDGTWSSTKGAPTPSVDQCITQVTHYVSEGSAMSSPYAGDFSDRLRCAAGLSPDTGSCGTESADLQTEYQGGINVLTTQAADSIHNRLKVLLWWLWSNFPQQGWDAYLDHPCIGNACDLNYEVNWDQVAIASHSMGTQMAAYFANQYLLDRAIFIAGPHPHLVDSEPGQAYVPTIYDTPGPTDSSRMYALLSEGDPNFWNQYYNHLYGTGLLAGSYADLTYVDLFSGFSDGHRLLIGTDDPPAGCTAHEWLPGTCGGYHYQAAWDWMLTN